MPSSSLSATATSAAKRALELVGGRVPIVDLVRVEQASRRDGLYNGICW